MGDAEFDALARELLDRYAAANPPAATRLGLHAFDDRLPDGSPEAVGREVEGWRAFRRRFAALDPAALSGGRPLDRELALFLLDLWIFEGEELRLWEALPAAPGVLADALLPLLLRDFAPLGERLARLARRLEAAPRFLAESRRRITRPVRLWGEVALETTEALFPLLASAEEAARGAGEGPRGPLGAAVAGAREALEDYAAWLRSEVIPRGSGEPSVGPRALARLLELRRLGLDADEARALALRAMEEAREGLRRAAAAAAPGARVEEVLRRVEGDRPPTLDAALDALRRAVAEAREFVGARRFATLPGGEELLVLPTPPVLRPLLPLAAYDGPGRWERGQRGLCFLTPPAEGAALPPRALLRRIALHQGYPGHHLQRVCGNLHPSPLRPLASGLANAEIVGGWALYGEGALEREGFDDTPEGRFAGQLLHLGQACRALIDVDLHGGRLGVEGAVELLVREAGIERGAALAEVKRLSLAPTHGLSALVGQRGLEALREAVRARLGPRYSDRFFHDTLLYSGGLPLALLRRAFEDKVGVFEEELPE